MNWFKLNQFYVFCYQLNHFNLLQWDVESCARNKERSKRR
jgi:hypothetical protein